MRRRPADRPRDERIYVLTPQARVVELPLGGTPIDFAYPHPFRTRTSLPRRARRRGDGAAQYAAAPAARRSRSLRPRPADQAATGSIRSSVTCVSARSRAKVRQWFNALEFEQSVTRGPRDRREGTAAARQDRSQARRPGATGSDSTRSMICARLRPRKSSACARSSRRSRRRRRLDEAPPTADRQAARSAGRDAARCWSSASTRLLTQLARCCRPGAAGRDRRLRDARPRRVDPSRQLLEPAGA